MARVLGLIFLLLFFCGGSAFASIPIGTEWRIKYPGENTWFPDRDSACAYGWPKYGGGLVKGPYTNDASACYAHRTTDNAGVNMPLESRGGACPANSTKSGSSCNCNAGYHEDGNQCVIDGPPDDVCGYNGQFAGRYNWRLELGNGPTLCTRSDGSLGCEIMAVKDGVILALPENVLTGRAFYSGEHCSGASAPEKTVISDPQLPEGDKLVCDVGEWPGQINGVDVCVPSAKETDQNNGKPLKEESTTTNPDGSTTKTTKTTVNNTECTGLGVCTTTTTVTSSTQNSNDPTNPLVTETTSTYQETIGQYCAKNPSSVVCRGSALGSGTSNSGTHPIRTGTGSDGQGANNNGSNNGSATTGSAKNPGNGTGDGDGNGSGFGGSCGGGFTCTGDAVQCAMAKEQYSKNCKIFEPQGTQEESAYAAGKGQTGNVTGDNPNNAEVAVGEGISGDSIVGGSGAGMHDVSITVMGQSINVEFSKVNPYLGMIGNVMLLVAWVLAFRIVGRG